MHKLTKLVLAICAHSFIGSVTIVRLPKLTSDSCGKNEENKIDNNFSDDIRQFDDEVRSVAPVGGAKVAALRGLQIKVLAYTGSVKSPAYTISTA